MKNRRLSKNYDSQVDNVPMFSQNKRFVWIDNIKCFAIILVVLGHLIQHIYRPITFDANYLFRYIYSFHMPLFIIISGILAGLTSNKIISKRDFLLSIRRRAIQLLLPFASWAMVLSYLRKDIYIFFDIIKQPDKGLWFLWVLFFIYTLFLLTKFIYKYITSYVICVLLVFVCAYLVSYILDGLFGSVLIAKYYLYYMIGYLFSSRIFLYEIKWRRRTIIYILLFLILGYFWKRTGNVFSPFDNHLLDKCANMLYINATALIGSISVILLFLSINKTNKLMSYIGKRTLGIYAIHICLIELFISFAVNIFPFYTIIIALLVTIFLSLLIDFLFSLNKYISLFFLGK